jgi:hypothetical protein
MVLKMTDPGRGTMSHSCSPTYFRGGNRRMAVQGQPREKVSDTLSQGTSQVWWVTLITPATREAEMGGLRSKAGPRQKCETLCVE